jgi:hypothetical protein
MAQKCIPKWRTSYWDVLVPQMKSLNLTSKPLKNGPMQTWKRPTGARKVLVGAGYAGRCDAYVKLKGIGDAIIDLKNRKVNPKYSPFYEHSDAPQLWAYKNASENPQAACVSIVLASNDSSKLMTRVWEDDELYQAGIGFNALLKVWAWVKGYTPPGMKL